MSVHEQLQRAREELELFKQDVQNNELIDQEFYQQRLEQMRFMKQRDSDFSQLMEKLNANASMRVGGFETEAMVMGQLNIEERIRRLEEAAAQEPLITTVPAEQIVAERVLEQAQQEVQQLPQAQRMGKWERTKRWFKRVFSKNAKNLDTIERTTVRSRAGEVQRANRAEGYDTIASPEEMRHMQTDSEGIRGVAGNFLRNRQKPVFMAGEAQTSDLFDALQSNGFDFKSALTTKKRTVTVDGKTLDITPAAVAMVTRNIEMWIDYLDNPNLQEVVATAYESLGNNLVNNTREKRGQDAMPTETDADNMVINVLPTKGMETFFSQRLRGDLSSEAKDFAKQCSGLFGRMTILDSLVSEQPELAGLLQPMLRAKERMKAKIAQIGAPIRARRIAIINNLPAVCGARRQLMR